VPLQKYIFNPGINREGTAYTAEGGWFDGNLVRFRKGLPEKIGGWAKETLKTYLGTGRSLHAWTTVAGTNLFGIATRVKLYIEEGNVFHDVTPIRSTTSAGDVTFSATNGSSTLTATDTSHGGNIGDFVTFSGAASLGGLITAAVLNQEYEIATVPSANTFTFAAKDTSGDEVTANSSDSGNGGSSVVGAYQISVGLDVFVGGTGWSSGTWGDSTFGSTSALTDVNQLRTWSQDNYGEDLVACVRAGGVYYWDASDTVNVRAKALPDLTGANLCPTKGLQVLVSDVDRHLIVLGADPISGTARSDVLDPLLIAWSDQGNPAEWEPKNTNTAGSIRCSVGAEIIGGLRARQETLVWTDSAMYSLQFIGPPYTFGLNLLNEGISLMGPNTAINTPKGVFWMDRKGFYTYNGSISPVPCSVHSYVFDDLNEFQSYQYFAFLNTQFDEVGWFYCSGTETVIDRYVTYNYSENTWSIGKLSRTAWLDQGIAPHPRSAGSAVIEESGTETTYHYVYKQETGNDADGSPMDDVYIESGDFNLGEGEDIQYIRKLIPDVRFSGENGAGQILNFVLKTRNYPAEDLSVSSTSVLGVTTDKVDLRARARQAVVRFESDDDADTSVRLGVAFRIGGTRLDVQPSGRR
jgi:hypothetical protein